MRRYLIIIEKTGRTFAAYTPELPGCAAAGKTIEETEETMYAALRLHLAGLETDKTPLPKSNSLAEFLVI
jgi:predicted RNase H-like HicB family nuclease